MFNYEACSEAASPADFLRGRPSFFIKSFFLLPFSPPAAGVGFLAVTQPTGGNGCAGGTPVMNDTG